MQSKEQWISNGKSHHLLEGRYRATHENSGVWVGKREEGWGKDRGPQPLRNGSYKDGQGKKVFQEDSA